MILTTEQETSLNVALATLKRRKDLLKASKGTSYENTAKKKLLKALEGVNGVCEEITGSSTSLRVTRSFNNDLNNN